MGQVAAMMMRQQTPLATYRRIDLEARIEASTGADLTRICLEEAIQALGQAVAALHRTPSTSPAPALSRAQSIAIWLAKAVDASNPMRAELTQFYGGLAAQIGANIGDPKPDQIELLRGDFSDVLEALTRRVERAA